MKNFIFLVAFCFYLNAFAKEQTITYKIKTMSVYPVTIICKGNFNKGILSDGPVEFYTPTNTYGKRIILRGNYANSTFTGTIKCGEVVLECSGKIYNDKNQTILAKKSATGWTIRLQFTEIIGFDLPIVSISIEDQFFSQTHKTGSSIREEDLPWIKLRDYVYKKYADPDMRWPIQNATISFTNGNKYIGPISYRSDRSPKWKIESMQDRLFEIKYEWSNGDSFKGLAYHSNDRIDQIMPERGIVKYQDGSIDSLWINNYPSFFTAATTPTQLRDTIQAIEARQREEERLREIRKEEERKAAKLREEQQKQQEREKKIARKNELIRKYGQRYGEAIFNKEPKIGMTIEMVQDMHQKQGRMTRRISHGNEITILSYGGDYVSFWGISGITARFKYTFVNGRLTEFSSEDSQASIDWL